MKKIAIVLPAHNEEQTVALTIEDFHAALPEASIWVINNFSSDKTELVAQNTLFQLGCNGGVINERNLGKGNAVRRAFKDIEADVYILADADLTYPAHQVRTLLAPVLCGDADMVVGDRHSDGFYAKENKRPLHSFGNKLVRFMVNLLFEAKLVDIMSGYRVLSRRFVKNYPILVGGFEIETDMVLHALDKRFTIIEIPVNYRDRPDGSFSKLSTIKDGVRVLIIICNIFRYYRPLLFFGGIAFILGFFGMLVGLPVINEWISDRYIYRIPSAILASGMIIIAIVFAAVGLILDSIAYQDRRYFERELLIYKDLN